MSYAGSDDGALCDGRCNRMYPPGWPNWVAPWPVTGPVFDPDGRMTSDHRDNFHICQGCLQDLVIGSYLRPRERAPAIRSKKRWQASQAPLDQAEATFRGKVAVTWPPC